MGMWHVLFTMYITDLPRHINRFTNAVLFADDTVLCHWGCGYSSIADTWRWLHHTPSRFLELLNQKQRITSHENWILRTNVWSLIRLATLCNINNITYTAQPIKALWCTVSHICISMYIFPLLYRLMWCTRIFQKKTKNRKYSQSNNY